MKRYVDTNILVRIITNDQPEQAQRALKLIESHTSGELVILSAVLAEVCFVLERSPVYSFSRATIVSALQEIIATPQFKVSASGQAALGLFLKNPKLDFVDCLLAAISGGKPAGVLSFDKDLLKALA